MSRIPKDFTIIYVKRVFSFILDSSSIKSIILVCANDSFRETLEIIRL
jgi:hypothetical protein